jgi:hypothetical protein
VDQVLFDPDHDAECCDLIRSRPDARHSWRGYLGDSPRGLMRGPSQFDWDVSLVKNTHLRWLGDAGNLQFRAELFNI